MKKFLWICMIAVLGFSCTGSNRFANQQEVIRFKMPDTPTIDGIYDTAIEYIGLWKSNSNCGDDHDGLGSHDISGVIQFKDNGQFEMGFLTYRNDSLVYQVKRDGYWTLIDEIYVKMFVAHEVNTDMEIIVINPEASLKVYFKITVGNGTGIYRNSHGKDINFQKIMSMGSINRF